MDNPLEGLTDDQIDNLIQVYRYEDPETNQWVNGRRTQEEDEPESLLGYLETADDELEEPIVFDSSVWNGQSVVREAILLQIRNEGLRRPMWNIRRNQANTNSS